MGNSLEKRLVFIIILLFGIKLYLNYIQTLPHYMSLDQAKYVANLKPTFFLHLDVEEPDLIYDNAAESLVYVNVTGGYTKTLDPAYPFETTVLHGLDNLRTSKASPLTTTLDCQLYLQSKTSDKRIHFYYTGILTANDAQKAVLAGKSKSHGYTNGYLTSHPTVNLDAGAREEAWITGKNLIGKGQFSRDLSNKLSVEYYFYVLE